MSHTLPFDYIFFKTISVTFISKVPLYAPPTYHQFVSLYIRNIWVIKSGVILMVYCLGQQQQQHEVKRKKKQFYIFLGVIYLFNPILSHNLYTTLDSLCVCVCCLWFCFYCLRHESFQSYKCNENKRFLTLFFSQKTCVLHKGSSFYCENGINYWICFLCVTTRLLEELCVNII